MNPDIKNEPPNVITHTITVEPSNVPDGNVALVDVPFAVPVFDWMMSSRLDTGTPFYGQVVQAKFSVEPGPAPFSDSDVAAPGDATRNSTLTFKFFTVPHGTENGVAST